MSKSDFPNEFKLQGIIKFIDPKTNVSKTAGKEFFTQTFCLSMEEESMGEVTENDIQFQAVRNNCDKLEPINVGDEVIVSFSMKGAFGGAKPKEGKPASDKNPKSLTCMSNANAWKIEVVNKADVTGASSSDSVAGDKQKEWDAQQKQEVKKIPKPSGKAPKGKEWNEISGEWQDELPF